jgi:hypothetical protein
MTNKRKVIKEKAKGMLNGIGFFSSKEAENRLNNSYLLHLIKEKPNFEIRMKFLHDYFYAMNLLIKGFKVVEASRFLRLKKGTIKFWLIGQVPHLIKTASQIPSEKPADGYKWLPISIGKGWKYNNFIQVPLEIKSYNDILNVIYQLVELKSDEKEKFKNIDKEFALGYVLGLMISDSDKDRSKNTTSTRLRLGLSKKYEYNVNIGEAFCYCLNKLGIKAKRYKDCKPYKKGPNGKFIWRTQYSPFISWLKECCLGLNLKETTTYTSVRCDWILNSSEKFRIAVLNGIYDGDGCSYIRGWQITNACGPNQIFLQNLLNIFNIKSKIRGPKVIIETKNDLKIASELCLFRFSVDRIEKTKILLKMLENSKYIHSRKDYKTIIERVSKLNKIGYEPKDIPFKIFNEFGIGIHPRRVYTILKRR